jgi:FixJ family two-component response regulator
MPPSSPLIAIVDDDDSVRTATALFVASLGYATDAFASAEEFLRSPRIGDTACLILDVHLPRMSGTELQTLLRKRGLRIPIVFITAHPRDELKALIAVEGTICFLAKPFAPAVLVRCIRTALGPR